VFLSLATRQVGKSRMLIQSPILVMPMQALREGQVPLQTILNPAQEVGGYFLLVFRLNILGALPPLPWILVTTTDDSTYVLPNTTLSVDLGSS
jgi:hypothetical protein